MNDYGYGAVTVVEASFGIEVIRVAAVLGPLFLMVLGLVLVFRRLRMTGQELSENDIRLVGIILFVPMLPFIAVILPDFPPEALITLLGTVGGYLLSHSEGNRRSRKDDDNAGDDSPD